MSLRVRLIGVAVLALILGLLPSTGALTQTQGQVLTIGTTDRITELSPANSYDYWTWHVFRQTTNGLVTIKPGTSEVIPALAKSWDISADGTVYTFKLRQGVTFTDGTAFNCAAMKWSIDRNLKLNGPKGGVYLISMIKETKCLDDYTLQITIKSPDTTFIKRLDNPPAWAYSPKSTPADTFAKGKWAGTGPYEMIEYKPEERVVYQAYDKYWGCNDSIVTAAEKAIFCPRIKKVIEVFYANAAALAAATQSGEVDIGFRTFNPDDIISMEKNPNLKEFKASSSVAIRYLVFNVTMAPFNNPLVREAIALSVDRSAIVSKVFAGINKPLYTMVPPGFAESENVFPARDLATARELLKQAGYTKDHPLEITLSFTPKHYGSTESDVAAVMKTSLEETGVIKLNLESLEWGTMTSRMSKADELPFFLLGWYPDFLDPDNFLAPWLTESTKSLGSFTTDTVNVKFQNMERTETDPTVRALIFAAWQGYMAADWPWESFSAILKAKLEAIANMTKLPAVKGLAEEAINQIPWGISSLTDRLAKAKELQDTVQPVVVIPLWQNMVQMYAFTKPNITGVVLDVTTYFRDWLIDMK
ncbi:MAG TPA: peptide ABC transporter substrate-binding protein [Candidatus Fraserbacteria bacterium]|nr:peptide ABC transporter substrate-binding protein [Candidatus Fraserbacteria bacterium]